mmetsp:Transcript_52716/g.163585  ORF Transcript_52716/g.163585 Transcript_52716/m.163585 type:complete len:139 (-) Transcript_52716:183-599(-)
MQQDSLRNVRSTRKQEAERLEKAQRRKEDLKHSDMLKKLVEDISSDLNPENFVKACNCYQSNDPATERREQEDSQSPTISRGPKAEISDEQEQERRRSLSQYVASLRTHSSNSLPTALEDQRCSEQEESLSPEGTISM